MRYFKPALALLIVACGCKRSHDTQPISGPWKIVKAVRNQDDITAGCDFGAPLIMLKADSTYSLGKTAPFAITNNGTWTARPRPDGYTIVLQQKRGDPFEMSYDTSGGQKHLIAGFSTASSNTYQYILEKINPKE